jgi:hypothetical protein
MVQNRELKDDGEEPLTPDEFFSCRAEDATLERGRKERLRIERWHATYNAALTGLQAWSREDHDGFTTEEAHVMAADSACLLHGELKP